MLAEVLASFDAGALAWLFVDEVTYVEGWDRTVEVLADAGMLERCFVLLIGSDQVMIQGRLKRLPGRRGRAPEQDFHLRPLSFAEFCRLRGRSHLASDIFWIIDRSAAGRSGRRAARRDSQPARPASG